LEFQKNGKKTNQKVKLPWFEESEMNSQGSLEDTVARERIGINAVGSKCPRFLDNFGLEKLLVEQLTPERNSAIHTLSRNLGKCLLYNRV